mmetsp:Transcript_31356/g.95885  ORF Transcript_31356/g.95885 Transcript_31356/m.95885 type:complete len:90 (+) Transcript_31356:1199-1468(+)
MRNRRERFVCYRCEGGCGTSRRIKTRTQYLARAYETDNMSLFRIVCFLTFLQFASAISSINSLGMFGRRMGLLQLIEVVQHVLCITSIG